VGHEWVELAAALHCPCAAVVFPPSDEVSPSHSSSGPPRPPLADGFSAVHDVAYESDLIRVAGMIQDHPPPGPDTDNQISASSEEPPCPPTRSLTESPSPPPLPPPPPGSQGPPWAVVFAALFRLVVLDLDDTLWQGDCVSLNRGPYALTNPTECVDTSGRSLRLFPEVPTILVALRAAGCTLAVASQCPAPPTARALLALFGLSEYFPPDLVVIGPLWPQIPGIPPRPRVSPFTPFTVDLQQIQARSGVPFGRTAFFDDRIPNVTVARRLGVTAVRVHAGLSVESVRTASRDQRSVTGARGRLRRWLSLS